MQQIYRRTPMPKCGFVWFKFAAYFQNTFFQEHPWVTASVILNKFKQINQLLFPLKSSENQRFFDNVMGNRSQFTYVLCLRGYQMRNFMIIPKGFYCFVFLAFIFHFNCFANTPGIPLSKHMLLIGQHQFSMDHFFQLGVYLIYLFLLNLIQVSQRNPIRNQVFNL